MLILINFIIGALCLLLFFIGFNTLCFLMDMIKNGVDINNIKVPNFFTFEYLYKFNPFIAINFRLIITLIILIVLIIILIYLFLGGNFFNFHQMPKSKFEKLNYHHFQNNLERRRGLYRLSYNKKGKLTENTLEHLLEVVLAPLYKAQNDLMRYYLKPRYNFWNLRKEVINDHFLRKEEENGK